MDRELRQAFCLHGSLVSATAFLAGVLSVRGWASEPVPPTPPAYPNPSNVLEPPAADEPLAPELSLAKAAAALDTMAVGWTRQRKCAHCHTNLSYLIARPALAQTQSQATDEVRKFFEDLVAAWSQADKPPAPPAVVAVAAGLAIHDAQTTGRLHPLTRAALARMWSQQRPDGSWPWYGGNYAPTEMNEYFGAVWAALGVGWAPEGYADSAEAAEGVRRLRSYFQQTAAPHLHDRAWLLWAASRLDGLLTNEQQEATIKDLLARQREDGGWNLPSLLGSWAGRPNKPLAPDTPSDGYATGLAVYVMRQARVPASRPEIQRGVQWLRSHQRASGHWLTLSPNSDRANLVTHGGTCLAVLAIKACE